MAEEIFSIHGTPFGPGYGYELNGSVFSTYNGMSSVSVDHPNPPDSFTDGDLANAMERVQTTFDKNPENVGYFDFTLFDWIQRAAAATNVPRYVKAYAYLFALDLANFAKNTDNTCK